MFRKPRSIILAAIALYAIALAVTWQQVDARADHRMETMLESAETGYSAVIDGEIDAALRNVGGAIINVLGHKCLPQSIERMRRTSGSAGSSSQTVRSGWREHAGKFTSSYQASISIESDAREPPT